MSDFINVPSKEQLTKSLAMDIENYKVMGYDISIIEGKVSYIDEMGMQTFLGY